MSDAAQRLKQQSLQNIRKEGQKTRVVVRQFSLSSRSHLSIFFVGVLDGTVGVEGGSDGGVPSFNQLYSVTYVHDG